MNTIFIITIMVYLEKKHNINIMLLFRPEHRLTTVVVKILPRNLKELS